jgi:hypothetical protein
MEHNPAILKSWADFEVSDYTQISKEVSKDLNAYLSPNDVPPWLGDSISK